MDIEEECAYYEEEMQNSEKSYIVDMLMQLQQTITNQKVNNLLYKSLGDDDELYTNIKLHFGLRQHNSKSQINQSATNQKQFEQWHQYIQDQQEKQISYGNQYISQEKEQNKDTIIIQSQSDHDASDYYSNIIKNSLQQVNNNSDDSNDQSYQTTTHSAKQFQYLNQFTNHINPQSSSLNINQYNQSEGSNNFDYQPQTASASKNTNQQFAQENNPYSSNINFIGNDNDVNQGLNINISTYNNNRNILNNLIETVRQREQFTNQNIIVKNEVDQNTIYEHNKSYLDQLIDIVHKRQEYSDFYDMNANLQEENNQFDLQDSQIGDNSNEQFINNNKKNNNDESSNEQNNVINSYFNNQLSKINYQISPQLISVNDTIQLCGGLVLVNGSLRHQKGLIPLSFGFQSEKIIKVVDKRDFNVISVYMQPDQNIIQPSVNEAIQFLEKYLSSNSSFNNSVIPSSECKSLRDQVLPNCYHNVKDKIANHIINKHQIKSMMKTSAAENKVFQQKEGEYTTFIAQCYQFLKEYEKNSGLMYQYCIGRFNLESTDLEMDEIGYSKNYLNLLGINNETFNSMMMRGKKIDFIQNSQNIHQQTIYTLLSCLQNSKEVQLYADINTFDGFQLNIFQKQIKVELPFHQQPNSSEFAFFFTEIDVNVNDLQNLIKYRQKIYNQNQELSYDDFIRKELSYLYEDVEYSVHSQSFLEKYYKEQLQELQSINHLQKEKTHKAQQLKKTKIINEFKPVQFNVMQKN